VIDDDQGPWSQLRAWIDEARALPGGTDMVLATADARGVPSARVVSLRGIDERGLRFYTHDGSRKTAEIAARPRVAVVMHFPSLHRQLRVEGDVEPLPRDVVEAYFATRPRAAQLSASVSRQGRPVSGDLRAELEALDARLGDAPVPCPPDFIGVRVVPSVIEFWRGSDDRLHDRQVWLRGPSEWRSVRLCP
jgi:pyridoxamine 5'-phosphate oxidase